MCSKTGSSGRRVMGEGGEEGNGLFQSSMK